MSGGTGIVRVSAEASTWLVSGDANAGGVSGIITSTGTAGDRWMLWGLLVNVTNCSSAALHGGSYATWIIFIDTTGTFEVVALDPEQQLVMLKII
jgi:hypothetical protein